MTKKGWTRILIVVVASLWGYNIYRTFENYQVKSDFEEVRENTNLSFSPVLFNKDTFDLVIPLDDPFLRNENGWNRGIPPSNSTVAITNRQTSNVAQTKPNEEIKSKSWPVIKYYGFLRNHDQNHKLCMLSIANKNFRMSVGDINDGITVIAAYPDSILVSYQNQVKAIVK